jgi:hypothetical protein
MKKLLFISLFAVALSGCSALPFLTKKQAALQVNSTPAASVYLNGNHVGQTPYFDEKIKPGEYTVRILVENNPAMDWQTKITLSPQIVTVLNRQFGATPDESSNYLLQLEPLSNNNSQELSIITIPDNVIVKIDGQPEGFSPVSVKDITEGDHTLTLTAPGYQEMTIQATTKKGYKLVVSATLARTPLGMEGLETATSSGELQSGSTATKSATPPPRRKVTPAPTKKPTSPTATGSAQLDRPYVIILKTPTGWLRVRSAPDANADNEIAKVNPDEQYKYLEQNDAGWYKIELQNGDEGWISGKYAELYK